jgi:hypothetical protein
MGAGTAEVLGKGIPPTGRVPMTELQGEYIRGEEGLEGACGVM